MLELFKKSTILIVLLGILGFGVVAFAGGSGTGNPDGGIIMSGLFELEMAVIMQDAFSWFTF